MRQRFRHWVFYCSLCCAFLLGAAKEALADEPAGIVIPPELGYVLETHPPRPDPNQSRGGPSTNPHPHPIIVHIQEAHTNYEGQQHLIGILDSLVNTQHLKLVLVEGGVGDASLAYLRSYGPPDNRKNVAERYLQHGLISGEEYLDIVSDYPLILWGVERKDLYQQNVQAFLEAERLQATWRPVLMDVRGAVERLKPVLSAPALQELEAQSSGFEKETVTLAAYGDFLAGVAAHQQLALNAYPNMSHFLAARRLERTIRLSELPAEQQALLQRLSTVATAEQIQHLVAKADQVKAGTLKREVFYTSLGELAKATGVPLEPYPHLAAYLSYIEERGQIKPGPLGDELQQLAAQLQQSLASTPESQQLQRTARELELIQKLLELQLAPAEYQELSALNLHGLSTRWSDFLSRHLAAHGLPQPAWDRLAGLEAALPTLQKFYEAAGARDTALVENTLAKLNETREPIAVLITGGFHAPEITKRLVDAGLGVVVVAPKVSTETDERLYRAVLKYKSGQGTFEDVVALTPTGGPSR